MKELEGPPRLEGLGIKQERQGWDGLDMLKGGMRGTVGEGCWQT